MIRELSLPTARSANRSPSPLDLRKINRACSFIDHYPTCPEDQFNDHTMRAHFSGRTEQYSPQLRPSSKASRRSRKNSSKRQAEFSMGEIRTVKSIKNKQKIREQSFSPMRLTPPLRQQAHIHLRHPKKSKARNMAGGLTPNSGVEQEVSVRAIRIETSRRQATNGSPLLTELQSNRLRSNLPRMPTSVLAHSQQLRKQKTSMQEQDQVIKAWQSDWIEPLNDLHEYTTQATQPALPTQLQEYTKPESALRRQRRKDELRFRPC